MHKISNNSSHIPNEVDIIVAGGGATGCVVAARLAKAIPALSILLIEAGIDNKDLPQVRYPALYLSNLLPNSKTAKVWNGNPSQYLKGREPIVPSGGCLGGGSSINFMMYTRGSGVDYDSWKMDGWTSKDLLPLLTKTETFHNDDPRIDRSLHGYHGDFNPSYGGFMAKQFTDDYMDAIKPIGMKEVADANDLTEGDGSMRWMKWIHPRNRLRQDAPHVLIHPLLETGDTGLQVLTEHKVIKILFEGSKAVGVEYFPTLGTQVATPATAGVDVPPRRVMARKLVVISAGAMASPGILERSGIGKRDVLERLDIPIVTELDGVGENYQDHHLFMNVYTTNLPPEQSMDPFFDGRRKIEDEVASLSDASQPHYAAWTGIDIAAKLRPTENELAAMSVPFRQLWEKDYANQKSRPLALLAGGSLHVGDHSTLPIAQYMTTACYSAYPYSRGHIHITSKDVEAPPDFNPALIAQDFDLEMLVWSYKRQREIVRRMKCFSGSEGVVSGPEFPATGKAKSWDWPVENGAATEYTTEDDEAIRDFIRDTVATTWHSCGTLAMRLKEEMGVVDARLNVYGVEGLKVADLSILPENVGGNTYSTALLVGEKAACIVAEELKIKSFQNEQ